MTDPTNTDNQSSQPNDDANKPAFSKEQQEHFDKVFNDRFKALKEKSDADLKAMEEKYKADAEEKIKLAKMKEDDAKRYEDEKKFKELEDLKKEKAQREHLDAITKAVSENKHSSKFSEYFSNCKDANEAKSMADKLDKIIDDLVLEGVNSKIGSHTPKAAAATGTGSANPFSVGGGRKFNT